MLCLVAQLCLTLCDPMDCSPPGSSVHADSPGKNTEVGCHVLLQGIFTTQGSNPGLPHCRWILYHLSHQGSPRLLTAIYFAPFMANSLLTFIMLTGTLSSFLLVDFVFLVFLEGRVQVALYLVSCIDLSQFDNMVSPSKYL